MKPLLKYTAGTFFCATIALPIVSIVSSVAHANEPAAAMPSKIRINAKIVGFDEKSVVIEFPDGARMPIPVSFVPKKDLRSGNKVDLEFDDPEKISTIDASEKKISERGPASIDKMLHEK